MLKVRHRFRVRFRVSFRVTVKFRFLSSLRIQKALVVADLPLSSHAGLVEVAGIPKLT